MEQIALNTVISVMMAIFPGFLFRKCYYRGEFTKQFSQSNELDKLLWNVFFSGISIGITFFSIYFFKSVTKFELLNSLSYDTIQQIVTPISKNEVPNKDLIYKTYKDLLIIITLIYSFSCFFGLVLHWLVRSLKLDVYSPLLRFKNYWHYYIHGGRILYSSPTSNVTPAFTVADILCEIAGETKLYKGIISQYTISKDDNNLENIFLTDARVLKQNKNEFGETISVTLRPIPGAAFCIPYKAVANMNLVYVYEEDKKRHLHKVFVPIINIVFFLSLTFIIASLWFDLSAIGVIGWWRKICYLFWSFVGLANIRLLIYKKDRVKNEWIGQLAFVLISIVWYLYFMKIINLWIAFSSVVIAIVIASIAPSKDDSTKTTNSDNNE